jgi:hypothetical protein
MIGHILYNATVILLTQALVDMARKKGNKGAEERALFGGRVAYRLGSQQAAIGASDMSIYDIIGADLFDDDDVGSIGGIEDLLVGGMGNSELVGDEDDSSAVAKRIAMKNAVAVMKSKVNKKRRYPLGFVPTDLAGGATQSIPSQPQNLYRAERLVIPSDIAFDIGITDIKVGNQSQFVQNVEVPAAVFSEVAIDTALHFDTAEVGNQLSISARNKTGVVVNFTAAIIGTAAK